MITVYGPTVDNQTRCKHYHSKQDVIAIKFKCCDKYYPCYQCHQECEEHEIMVWEKNEFEVKAILCGVCEIEHTISEYMNTSRCLQCNAEFNEGCSNHYHLYFQV
ncbi:CHY zinc finger protein [Ornithinibacillus scapharcae]|uniref:CHY zinc finger protein n=1 Tax=Ornithinibacillus scapharcae TaxID=1147159 RepID=UPI000225AE01|nr:CHY zinc finger protein [Ornithinibacillus scapharcae]